MHMFIFRAISLFLLTSILSFTSEMLSVAAYGWYHANNRDVDYGNSYTKYTPPTRSSNKAGKFVNNFVMKLQNNGYSTSEITNALNDLRSAYVKRQHSRLYTGSALLDIEAIIDELDTAIAWVSEGTCSSCSIYDPFNVALPPRNSNYYTTPYNSNTSVAPTYNYPNYSNTNTYPYNSNNSSNTYPYNSNNYYNTYTPPSYSNYGALSVSTVSFSVDTYASTQTRVDLIHANNYTNSYRDYDVYTYIPQTNNYNNSQSYSNQFIATSLIRTLNSAQGRTIGIYYGAETDYSRIQNIRTLANNSIRTSQAPYSLSSSITDSFTSLSADDFNRQAIATGTNRVYRLYKLYIAKDNSEAFIIDYLETGTTTLSRNITGLDLNSFVDNGSYFSHSYTANTSKRYKNYLYIPAAWSNATNIYNSIGITTRAQYQAGTTRSQYVNGQYTSTAVNGYTVYASSIGNLESFFAGYSSPSSVILPGSNAQISFAPLSNYNFQYARLSDNTYRAYRLLVAEDNSDASITEYIENQPY